MDLWTTSHSGTQPCCPIGYGSNIDKKSYTPLPIQQRLQTQQEGLERMNSTVQAVTSRKAFVFHNPKEVFSFLSRKKKKKKTFEIEESSHHFHFTCEHMRAQGSQTSPPRSEHNLGEKQRSEFYFLAPAVQFSVPWASKMNTELQTPVSWLHFLLQRHMTLKELGVKRTICF